MKKLILLLFLFLMPNLVMGKICFVDYSGGTVNMGIKEKSNLKVCTDGDKLFYRVEINAYNIKDVDTARELLINRRLKFCDLKYETYIEKLDLRVGLTCIFKGN